MHAHAPGPGHLSPTTTTTIATASSVHGNAALSDSDVPLGIRHHIQGALLVAAPPRPHDDVEFDEVVVDEAPPPPTTTTTRTVRAQKMVPRPGPVVGKVHFALPPLRDSRPRRPLVMARAGGAGCGDEDGGVGNGTANNGDDDVAVVTVLEVAASPYFGRQRLRPQSADQSTVGGGGSGGGRGGDIYFSLPAHGPTKIICVELYAGRTLVGAWAKGGSRSLPADRDFRLHVGSDVYGEGEAQKLVESSQGLGVTLTMEFSGEDDGEEGLLVLSVALVQTIGGSGSMVDAV
jgi:hypothetical protein